MSGLLCVACNTGQALLPEKIGAQLCKKCYLDDSIPGTSSSATGCDAKTDSKIKEPVMPSTLPRAAKRKTVTIVAPEDKPEVARWTRLRNKAPPISPVQSPKLVRRKNVPRGKGRRSLFKSTPRKAPSISATITTSDYLYYEGKYMQAGDIVSMLDEEGDTYYAQIRSFVTDQYQEKSAVITWLLPTKASPPPSKCFDPATYIIGPDEELPRKLEYMEFVMHISTDYYKSASPYPVLESERVRKATGGFIWSSVFPVDKPQ